MVGLLLEHALQVYDHLHLLKTSVPAPQPLGGDIHSPCPAFAERRSSFPEDL